MDAMPINLSQQLSGWSAQIGTAQKRLRDIQQRLHLLAQGGTAVGTGINTPPQFGKAFAIDLSKRTGLTVKANASIFESISSQDTTVKLSGQLKCTATAIMKIASDQHHNPILVTTSIRLSAIPPPRKVPKQPIRMDAPFLMWQKR